MERQQKLPERLAFLPEETEKQLEVPEKNMKETRFLLESFGFLLERVVFISDTLFNHQIKSVVVEFLSLWLTARKDSRGSEVLCERLMKDNL